jgi:hypothetical protein
MTSAWLDSTFSYKTLTQRNVVKKMNGAPQAKEQTLIRTSKCHGNKEQS